MHLDGHWLRAFLLTELIEAPIYCFGLRNWPWPIRFVWAFGASLLTHPIVWWSITTFGQDRYWRIVTGSELFAVLTEAVYLRVLGVPRAFEWSLVANGTSYGFGLACQFLLGVD